MIVDASAVPAILLHEEDAARFARAIETADDSRMSVVNYVEAAVRIDGFKSDESSRDFDHFMRVTEIELHDVTAELAETARSPTFATARETTRHRSISATALPMPWPRRPGNPCCSRARISPRPTFQRRCRRS